MVVNELYAWLTLAKAPGLGPVGALKLLAHFKTVARVVLAGWGELRSLGLSVQTIRGIKKPPHELIEADIQWSEREQNHIVTWADADYPSLLKEIAAPPILLYLMGKRSYLETTQIAIVGSRNPTRLGLELAFEWARDLAELGFTITSGLALGIDAASHRGALQAQGRTLAILGSGLLNLYPKRHRQLAFDIVNNGVLVSEFPLQAPPKPHHFPQRNRIISGLSLGTLVVEAAPKSGSLITATYALDQGREVFAIPGSVKNPYARGCHRLIQQGAKLVENKEDILVELGALQQFQQARSPDKTRNDALDSVHWKLLECVDYNLTPVERIIERSGLNVALVNSMLLIIELNGYISCDVGGYVRVK